MTSTKTKAPKLTHINAFSMAGLLGCLPLIDYVVPFDTKTIDVLNEFDVATYTFTPTHAGTYLVSVTITVMPVAGFHLLVTAINATLGLFQGSLIGLVLTATGYTLHFNRIVNLTPLTPSTIIIRELDLLGFGIMGAGFTFIDIKRLS